MSVLIGVTGNDFVVELVAGLADRYRTPTLADLLNWLRLELNDTLETGNPAGTYTEEELTHFLNRAKSEVELRTCCHQVRVAVPLTAGVHTYDVAPVFGVVEVSRNGATLTLTQLEDMATRAEAWDGASNGTPTEVLQLSGSALRLYPPPDAAAVAQPLVVHGYAISEALVQGVDVVDSIPVGFASDAMLEGGKAFAYKARPTSPVNVSLAAEARARFEALCGAIEQALKAGAA